MIRVAGKSSRCSKHVLRLVVGDGFGDVDGFERQVAHVVEALVRLVGRDAEDVREARHELGAIAGREFLAVDDQRGHRLGLGEHPSLDVEDAATQRRHLHDLVGVGLGRHRQALATCDLEEPQPGQETREERDDHQPDDDEPAPRVDFRPHVVDPMQPARGIRPPPRRTIVVHAALRNAGAGTVTLRPARLLRSGCVAPPAARGGTRWARSSAS